MRIKLLATVAVLSVVVVAPALADDTPYFGTEGNTWAHETVTEAKAGGVPTSSKTVTTYKVTAIKDNAKGRVAEISVTTKTTSIIDGKEYPMPETKSPPQFWPLTPQSTARGEGTVKGGSGTVKTGEEEEVKVPAGDFDCLVTRTEAAGTTTVTYTSLEHPGLLVKSVTESNQAGMVSRTVTTLTTFVMAGEEDEEEGEDEEEDEDEDEDDDEEDEDS